MNIADMQMVSILPQMLMLAAALVVFLADLVWKDKKGIGLLALAGALAAGAVTAVLLTGPTVPTFQHMAVADRFALVINLVVSAAAVLALLISLDYVSRVGLPAGEYYGLLLLAAGGMMFLGSATHLMTLFLSLEILSIALYALAGIRTDDVRSGEAAMKYFLLGAFASAFLLYGMALLYGATGTTSLAGIAVAVPGAVGDPMLIGGLALLLIGFAFKIAAVPFHMWTPDVYQGAPSSVTAFMSVGAKAAGFAALVRVLVTVFPALYTWWVWPVGILSVLTMTWGNLAALAQGNVKRMLAYSSIAHAGYILVGAAAGEAGVSGVLFYLMAYALMNIGAFAVLIALERAETDAAGVELERMRGLFHRRPWLAAAMTIFLFSLAGVPPMAGFFGKLYVFRAAVQSNLMVLAIIGVINRVISAYYYLRVVARMALSAPAEDVAPARCLGLSIGTGIAAVGTVLLGIYPTWLLNLVQGTMSVLFGG
ncbi:MAG: NADH-quinone oxidoreductase subunit N [Anaerolineae bacterium]